MYRAPCPIAGTKPLQTPKALRDNGFIRGFQPLKSPMTETSRAFGAQVAKWVPDEPLSLRVCAPSFS